MGALQYVAAKIRRRPVTTIDTAAVGLFVYPFGNKWLGFGPWWKHLPALLRLCAAAGLILAVRSPNGRLLLVVLIGSLIPYAFTWSVGGGGEWRFTEHAYPIYLVFAFAMIVGACRALVALSSRRTTPREALDWIRHPGLMAATAALLLGWVAYRVLPYLVVRESIAAGEAGMIRAGDRDAIFFDGAWSRPHGSGNVVVRAAMGDRVSLRMPLPKIAEYALTLRMDPAQPSESAYVPRVTVFLDGQTIGQVRFQPDPSRIGTYRMPVPKALSGRFTSRLDLVATHTVAASDAGSRFAWLDPRTPVAFYLRYVRVEPLTQ
jgi:hypothetical protein